jgi:dihydrofolate synthase/folylpolyglutamate synthase
MNEVLSTYKDSVDFLYSLQKFGIKFGLNQTENLLERLGKPQDRLRCIHIAGSNGKGSTGAILASLLRAHGYRVGFYTSPHLVRFTERFKINDREVEPERILQVFEEVRAVIDDEEPPTFFEVVTAMGFLYFAQESVDWTVVETGMGGRLDATNVVTPKVSIITNVSLEHQEYLGTTLTAIAREKAGIVKQEVPVVTGAKQAAVLSVLKATCMDRRAPLYRMGSHFRVRRNRDGSFRYQGMHRQWNRLRLNLAGAHQRLNAGLALAAVEELERQGGIRAEEEEVIEGLETVRWPARLEVLERDPLIVLDGAHNADGAERLREALKQSFDCRRIHLVLGIMGDKDIRGMLRRLLPVAETAIFTKPAYVRGAEPEKLKELAGRYLRNHFVIPGPAEAIDYARQLAAPEDCICIAGSLYFAGEVKELFGEKPLF